MVEHFAFNAQRQEERPEETLMKTTREQAEEIVQALLDRGKFVAIDYLESALAKPRPWIDGKWMHFAWWNAEEAKKYIGKTVRFYDWYYQFNSKRSIGILESVDSLGFLREVQNNLERRYPYIAIPISEIEKE